MAAETVPVIDAHHHLWRYTPAEYGWIDDSMAALRRDFLPTDLLPEIQSAGIDRTIAVQARQTVEETAWLLELAAQNNFIAGVIGWAPLASPELPAFLSNHADHPKLVGLRHIVQAEPACFLDTPAFNAGIAALIDTSLVYDILIFECQLEEATRFVDRHPHQSFVLDHIAKPRIADELIEPWRTHIGELARRPNVVCKLSGMVTEAGAGWTEKSLLPYFDTVVEAFGPHRLLAGSDWPVCLAATGYARWWQTLRNYFSSFTEFERTAIFGGTAAAIYLHQHPQRN
jgi:L-fuconolactonase